MKLVSVGYVKKYIFIIYLFYLFLQTERCMEVWNAVVPQTLG